MNPWIMALVVPLALVVAVVGLLMLSKLADFVADRTSTFWGGCVIASPFVIVMYFVGVGALGGFN
ncbi:hypothetical protein [Curtobacterium sp. MCLR17_034]|uniref:hypothetical protein n=1 Tax=Curtobacterium sp. MCLR17_034 TaxID=2175623 RepID=UPI000DAAA425|nr:hypothetical protein [Curtobacterium sp. MCLR17_034]PZF11755.1 hypothetical protein DEI98_06445 [Curtobacterium sp. MCLR17_034]